MSCIAPKSQQTLFQQATHQPTILRFLFPAFFSFNSFTIFLRISIMYCLPSFVCLPDCHSAQARTVRTATEPISEVEPEPKPSKERGRSPPAKSEICLPMPHLSFSSLAMPLIAKIELTRRSSRTRKQRAPARPVSPATSPHRRRFEEEN